MLLHSFRHACRLQNTHFDPSPRHMTVVFSNSTIQRCLLACWDAFDKYSTPLLAVHVAVNWSSNLSTLPRPVYIDSLNPLRDSIPTPFVRNDEANNKKMIENARYGF